MENYIAFAKVQTVTLSLPQSLELGEYLDAAIAALQNDDEIPDSEQFSELSRLLGDFTLEYSEDALYDELEAFLIDVCEECEELLAV